MSLVALKRKSLTKYNQQHSANSSAGFSINGVIRNNSYIGKSSNMTNGVRTPFKGDTPRGHGGCCGTYGGTIISAPQPYVNDLETPFKSVKSTNGYLEQYLHHEFPNYWVDPGNAVSGGDGVGVVRKGYEERLRDLRTRQCNGGEGAACTTFKDRIFPNYYYNVGDHCYNGQKSKCTEYNTKKDKYGLSYGKLSTGKGCVC